MVVRALILGLLWPLAALAQGFAGLGTDAAGFAVPVRGTEIRFPRDHAAHPDFRIEWWYVTANLRDDTGRDYGVQWTLFRSAMAPGSDTGSDPYAAPGADPGWATPHIWLGHAAVTTPDAFHHAERWGRGGIGTAGATADPVSAWIDDWHLDADPALSRLRLRARDSGFAFDLHGSTDRPIVLHGDRGYSVKSANGQASYYFSQPHFRLTGTLDLPEGPVAVTGTAWLDREWSSQPLAASQTGWDWFSLHLDNGDKVMGFRLRQDDGPDFTSGTWIGRDGTIAALPDGALRLIPEEEASVAGRRLPVTWRFALPERGIDLVVRAVNRASFMDTTIPYWEGPVRISGSHTGRGFLEMTGY